MISSQKPKQWHLEKKSCERQSHLSTRQDRFFNTQQIHVGSNLFYIFDNFFNQNQ